MEQHANLKSWADADKPREKLLKHGTAALSDTELLAILLRTGTTQETVVELARRLLASVHNNLDELGKLTIGTLQKNFKGIGETKAITLIAALERPQIRCSEDVAHYFQPMLADLPHEEFWTMTLNRQNKVIGTNCISKGGISTTVVDIKLIMRNAIEQLAGGLILCHNHPSGNQQPSTHDQDITAKLKEACQLFDIQLIDHVIIAGKGFYSFADNNRL